MFGVIEQRFSHLFADVPMQQVCVRNTHINVGWAKYCPWERDSNKTKLQVCLTLEVFKLKVSKEDSLVDKETFFILVTMETV